MEDKYTVPVFDYNLSIFSLCIQATFYSMARVGSGTEPEPEITGGSGSSSVVLPFLPKKLFVQLEKLIFI